MRSLRNFVLTSILFAVLYGSDVYASEPDQYLCCEGDRAKVFDGMLSVGVIAQKPYTQSFYICSSKIQQRLERANSSRANVCIPADAPVGNGDGYCPAGAPKRAVGSSSSGSLNVTSDGRLVYDRKTKADFCSGLETTNVSKFMFSIGIDMEFKDSNGLIEVKFKRSGSK